MKRILIFSLSYYPSYVSGAESAIKDTTDRIDDIEFHMVTLLFDRSALREELIGNVHVHRVGFGGAYLSKIFFVPLAALKARSLNKIYKFDALWVMMTYMLFPLALARVLGVKIPYVLSLQDGDPYEKVFERWFIKPVAWMLNYGFRHASVVQVISKFLGTWPEKRGYKGKIELIYDGANPRDLKQVFNESEINDLKNRLGKKEGEVWLVNTARLVYQKGNDDTIRALSALPENVKFLVVGDGSDKKMLENLTAELNLKDRVIFTGSVERSIVTKYRKASDVFVMPSRSEGLGHAALSAMASYLPVIATQEGGLAEYILAEGNPYGQTAWVIEKDNAKSISYAVKDIIAHPDKVEEVTRRSRKMVEEKYDWDMIAKDMRKKVFGKVL